MWPAISSPNSKNIIECMSEMSSPAFPKLWVATHLWVAKRILVGRGRDDFFCFGLHLNLSGNLDIRRSDDLFYLFFCFLLNLSGNFDIRGRDDLFLVGRSCCCCIFIILSRESDQCAIRARLGVSGHLSTTPRWGNPAKCLSQRHNK